MLAAIPTAMQTPPDSHSRRTFLSALGLTTALGTAVPSAASAADSPLEADLPSPGADLGSLWPTVQRIAEQQRYADAFLDGRFATFPEFQKAARAKLFELLQYRPEPVNPAPELIEKIDCGEYTREKILFSTSPGLRVPAYVLVPKNLKGP
ncbi:MAG: hypothetical protein IT580_24405, partial [Verrucomicrobiales bacterium]|nr:hypothetical protein [Verrucomicrobiales bacterium]